MKVGSGDIQEAVADLLTSQLVEEGIIIGNRKEIINSFMRVVENSDETLLTDKIVNVYNDLMGELEEEVVEEEQPPEGVSENTTPETVEEQQEDETQESVEEEIHETVEEELGEEEVQDNEDSEQEEVPIESKPFLTVPSSPNLLSIADKKEVVEPVEEINTDETPEANEFLTKIKRSTTATGYLNFVMMQGGDINSFLPKVCEKFPKFKIRSIVGHMNYHKKKGWIYEEEGDYVRLVGKE